MSEVSLQHKLAEVAQRMRALREAVGLTAREAAEKIGISEIEYFRAESGESDLSFTIIYKFAQICGVEMTELLEGAAPELRSYTVTRKNEGMRMQRQEGYIYDHMASMFKNRIADPFYVTIPYSEEILEQPLHFVTHKGQEMNIVMKGCMKMYIGNKAEILHPGDCIYFDSTIPHCEVAIGGEDLELYAILLDPDSDGPAEIKEAVSTVAVTNTDLANLRDPIYAKFVDEATDPATGILTSLRFKNTENFNFAFDIVDGIAAKNPTKTAMIHLDREKNEKIYTFSDISRLSAQTANYFRSLGIRKGDKVMLVLKRHPEFWFSILALHKIGAVAIPATNQLKEHDFEYRYRAGNVSAIICTADGETAEAAEAAIEETGMHICKVMVGDNVREGWHDFRKEVGAFDKTYEVPSDESRPCGDETVIMFFTSGTTGYPKIAKHSHKYALGHFVTAKYWHNVDPNGLHFTISDTGWGKALWGKLYGQWLCETPVFVYDFDRFDAADILMLMQKYKVTTFCAPPTMYRFFIREDLSKYDLSSVKYATVAGEALNPEVYNRFLRATGIKLMEGFGQTETTLTIANLVGMPIVPGSMGRPNPQYEVDIIDLDGNSVKTGETGEIVIRAEEGNVPCGLFKGYYGDKEQTAAVWHDGYYHTGDTAWRDENGNFRYVGRVDDVIKSSGYRIGPFEIESVIMELPYVLECAVVAAPDEIRGQVVKAVIVLTKGTDATDALKKEIQQYVKDRTAPYKYPRIVEFRDEMPKTISGKIIRAKLRS